MGEITPFPSYAELEAMVREGGPCAEGAQRWLDRERSPLACQAPDVVTGTQCLRNTSGRCTWCGRRMPGPPRERPVHLAGGEVHLTGGEWNGHHGLMEGTDPVAFYGDGD